MSEWDKLPDYLKESNLQQANDIIVKLCRIGCTARRVVNRHIREIKFTEDEVEAMAQMEHARWNEERLHDGWKLCTKRDALKKASPYLVDWSDLPDEAKEQDRQAVRGIPRFLATVGLEVLRKRKR
jgi:thiamine kinase-like enzyme